MARQPSLTADGLARFDELADRLAEAEASYAVAVRADAQAAQAAASALSELDRLLAQRYRVSALLDHVRRYGRGNAQAALRQAMDLQTALARAEADSRQALRQADELSEVTRVASLNALLGREAAHFALRSAMALISADAPDWGPDIPLPVLVSNYREALVRALAGAETAEVEAKSVERPAQLARPTDPVMSPGGPGPVAQLLGEPRPAPLAAVAPAVGRPSEPGPSPEPAASAPPELSPEPVVAALPEPAAVTSPEPEPSPEPAASAPPELSPEPGPSPRPAVVAAGPGPVARLLAEGIPYTDEELVLALRSRLAQLEGRADDLEGQVIAAQARLGALVKKARARSQEAEVSLVATTLSWARQEALTTLEDARRRAAELGTGPEAPEGLGELGELLVSHFQLQEQLVNLTAELALETSAPGQGS
jgi:hypothetical protein